MAGLIRLQVLDELGEAMTRRTLEMRAHRVLRDSALDQTLGAVWDALEAVA